MRDVVTNLLAGLPRVYNHEGCSREDLLFHGSCQERARESLKILIYYFSNNSGLGDLGHTRPTTHEAFWRDEGFWAGIQFIFEATGLLMHPPPFDLRERGENYTISAFSEKLFTALIHNLTEYPYTYFDTRVDFCLKVVRWLLLAGQDPDIPIPLHDDLNDANLPIGLAAESVNVELAKLLLHFGANLSLTDAVWAVLRQKYDTYEAICADTDNYEASDIGESQKNMSDPDSEENTMFELLVHSTPEGEGIVSLDNCLLMSLEYGDIYIARRLCDLGASLRCRGRLHPGDLHGLSHFKTALSAICYFRAAPQAWSANSPPPVQFVIDMLRELDVDVLSESCSVADAFIAATLSENHATIRYLASIGGDINGCNEFGITPLHAAACLTSGATCELLLQLSAAPNGVPHGYPSPLHVACLKNKKEIVEMLVSAGAYLEAKLDSSQISRFKPFRHSVMKDMWSFFVDKHARTPLEIASYPTVIDDDASIARYLVTAGATITKLVVVNAVKASDIELLRVALQRSSVSHTSTLIHPSQRQQSLNHSADAQLWASILHFALGRLNAKCSFLMLEYGVSATWDEIAAAGALVRQSHRAEDTALVSQIARSMVTTSNYYAHLPQPPPGLLFLPFFWCDPETSSVPGLFGSRPHDYCSIGLLLAVLASIKAKDSSLVQFVLEARKRTDRKAPDVFEGTSVAAAAMSGHAELFELLLVSLPPMRLCVVSLEAQALHNIERGFDVSLVQTTVINALFFPNALRCYSPLVLPVAVGQTKAASQMMSAGYEPDTACLLRAITSGASSFVQAIISGHRHLPPAPLHSSVTNGPLYAAVEAESDEVLELLLSKGITGYEDPSRIALSLAIKERKDSMIEMLLTAGVGIHSQAVCTGQRTALQQAAESRNFDVVRRLLEAGVDANQAPAPRYGATALQLSAIHGQIQIVNLLVQHGADVNTPGSEVGGRTALEAAAEYGRLDVAKTLLELGFDTSTRQGRAAYVRAVGYANERHHATLERMLRKYRAWSQLDEYLYDNLEVAVEDNTLYIDPDLLESWNGSEVADHHAESMNKI